MYSIVTTWLQRSRELENILRLFNIGQYENVYQNITFQIQNNGYANTSINHIYIRAKAALETSHSRDAIADLTYIMNNNTKFDQKYIRALRAQAYLNIGDVQNATNDAYLAKLPLSFFKNVKKAICLLSLNSHDQFTIERLLKICPESTQALMAAAIYFRKQNNPRMFYRYARVALEYEPYNANIVTELVNFHVCNEEFDEARKLLINSHMNTSENVSDAMIEDFDPQVCYESDKLVQNYEVDKMIQMKEQGYVDEAFLGLTELARKGNPRAFYERAKLFLESNCEECAKSDLKRSKGFNDSNIIISQLKMKTPCQILELASKCSRSSALNAFRKLAREWHPDRFHTPLAKYIAEKKMRKINKAMEEIDLEPFDSLFGNGEDSWLVDEDGAHIMRIQIF